nr:energy-coupling factor transporter transmembrane protein EcfT [Anaerolineae bacterium]
MLVAWKYKERNTLVQRLDPRARWIFLLAVLFSAIQFWDIRFLLFFFAIAFAHYFFARLTWKETRRVWMFVLLLVVVIIGINAVLTGRGGPGAVLRGAKHIIWQVELAMPWVDWTIRPNITVEKLVFAVTQMVRMLSIAVLFIPIPFTINPSQYGVTFRGLGLPDKFAFSGDLAFRFVPTLARDFSITLDSQRARGYEVEKLEGGLIAQIRKMAPLVVPVTINAIVGGEDIVNAMDLRCFGLRKRTWVHKLEYKPRDYVLIALGVLILAGSTFVNVGLGLGDFWVPEWVLKLFGF